MTPHQEAILATGRATLRSEAEALNAIEATLSDEFIEAVETILACRGKLIVSGLGKSGHVARKITATLTSTGTPALFLHSAEAAHGDVGIIGKDDMILARHLGEPGGLSDKHRAHVLQYGTTRHGRCSGYGPYGDTRIYRE